jgi:hypothetical protein
MTCIPGELPTEPDTGSLEELCRRADVSLTVEYELANRNAFPVPVFRVGRQFRYSRRAWDELMSAQHPNREREPLGVA